MVKTYPAIFHVVEEGGFWIEFPEFKGGTEGESIDDAMNKAQDFLASFIAFYIDEGKELPTPTDIRKISVDDGFVSLVQANPTKYIKGNKTVRKNVTVPTWLAKRAEKENINFSETLADALMEKIAM